LIRLLVLHENTMIQRAPDGCAANERLNLGRSIYMFSWLRRTKPEVAVANRIAEGTKISGNVESESDFLLSGTLDGTLTTRGRVVIGERGMLLGNLKADSVVVLGHLEGDVESTGHLEIGSRGKILGDVTMTSFSVQSGGVFRGSSRMRESVQDASVGSTPLALPEKPVTRTLRGVAAPGKALPSHPPPTLAESQITTYDRLLADNAATSSGEDIASETPPAVSVQRTKTLPPPALGTPPPAKPFRAANEG
jgi:cytoskeletal protein CcmA (bactofilin family)